MDPDASALEIAKFLLPKAPGMLYAALAHSLGLSATASKWDLQLAIQMAVLRQTLFNDNGHGLKDSQAVTLKDGGPKGKLWTAPARIPVTKVSSGSSSSGDGVCEAVFKVIAELGDGHESFTKPASAELNVEWTGFRSDAKTASEPLPSGLSPQQRYDRLMADPVRTSDVTVLYLHGGAYYLCGFATHRVSVSRLAKACGGRALAVEYRLAPQAAFPSQLIDALNAYLYLLYPPEDALHEPVPADKIVFAGDSAGGHLSFCLLQFLLTLHRTNKTPAQVPTISYRGKDVPLPLPAGVGSLSPWLDISRSSPSWYRNAKWDYLPNRDAKSSIPSDDIWPAKPPRGEVFCDLSLLSHPLVALVTADWTGSPPLWITAGDEMLYDEIAVLAAAAKAKGVTVQWEHYEAMPHVFSMICVHLASSKTNIGSWGQYCKDAVAGNVSPKSLWFEAQTGNTKEVELEKEASLSFAQMQEKVKETTKARLEDDSSTSPVLAKPDI